MRPKGFFLKSSTAGAIFTMAGIVSNSVHGGFYNEGYISGTVKTLRVAVVDRWNVTKFKLIYSND